MFRIALIFFIIFFVSCNSDSSKHDADTVADKDTAVIDSDANDSAPDESGDADTILPDPDSITDTDLNDSEFIDDCDIKLIDAKFPYYDKDSNITFCRPGCDTPTEKDPQCMSNLWKEQNQALCTQMPQYDCCGYPCFLESLKPMTKDEVDEYYQLATIPMHKCDLKLNPKDWGIGGSSVMKSWNMSDGKVGFYLYTVNLSMKDWSVKTKFSTYEIATKKFNFILPARGQEQAYYKGSRIALISDKRSLELNNSNIFLAYIGDDGLKILAYNKKVHHMAYEPALNDKWAFVNLQETDNSPYKMMYAKVGEWKWTSLGEGTGWEPGIVGNTLVLVDDNVNGWICDLSKNPKSISECRKVNRNGEEVRGIRINLENEKQFIYNSNISKLVYLELEDGTFSYKDLITDFTEATVKNKFSLAALQFKKNILLFEEITSDGYYPGGLLCYYRLDKNEKYCMKKMDKDESYTDGTTRFPYGFAEFENKWLLYQKKGSTPLILRDMDCYCKEEGICPFE